MAMILVVDDEPGIRTLMALALRQEGFSVLTANTGADAIEIWRSHRDGIGLVITDVRVAGIDGPAIARAMASDDPGLPILFMSASNLPDMSQVERAGFLGKPFTIERLVEEVRGLMREASLTQSAGRSRVRQS
jgi:DNA-binding NtrC family response regulator